MANTKITNPELFNLGDSTSATQLPVMTTMQRTDMTGLSVGEMIFNSTTDKVEYWDGTKWYGITYEVAGESPYNNVLYTGTSLTNPISQVGFSPDLVWLKQRNSAQNHGLFDTVRGTNNFIMSNSTSAENTRTTDTLSSFDADGFTVTPYSSDAFINYTGRTMVAWCFKAGGAAVANTDGSVASQVSANAAGGFSIVEYTGVASGTVGHGLNVPPELIITKQPGVVSYWQTYAAPLGKDKLLQLNSNGAEISIANYWGTNPPTATVFGLSTNSGHNPASGLNIAYCFASVAGYSKIGSYIGNGTTGQLIPTDFQPRFLLVKCSSSGLSYHDWYIFDNKRTPSNPSDAYLKANKMDSEQQSLTYNPTFESTGFRWEPGDNSGGWNGSGFTYIYMAFA